MKKIKCLSLLILFGGLFLHAQERKNVFEYSIKPVVSSFKEGSVIHWGMGLGWQHNFSRYFAWDILHVEAVNTWKKYEVKNTTLALLSGPKVLFPVSDDFQPFFSFKVSYGGVSVSDLGSIIDKGSFGISPEIGIFCFKRSNISIGYHYSWAPSTTVNETTTEKYVTGSYQRWLYSQNRYITIYEYGTRTVATSMKVPGDSGGVFYVRLGAYF